MLASTFYDLVIGVDIHLVNVPTPGGPVPTPVPMPFIGMVFDPKGLLIGAAINLARGGSAGLVLVNEQPATACGTSVITLSPHLPAPGVSFTRGKVSNDAELYFGADKVSVTDHYPVRLGDLALSCSDPVRMPTSIVLAVPKGRPVLIVKPMVFDAAGYAQSIAMHLGMKVAGKLAKRLAKAAAKGAKRFTPKLYERLAKLHPSRGGSFWSRAKCVFTGHPVDVVSGRLMTQATDVQLHAALPIVFERVYDSSRCDRKSALGWGWSHSLEEALWEERGKVVYLAPDGREIEFLTHDFAGKRLEPNQTVVHEVEHLTLRCESSGVYTVISKDGTTRLFATHAASATHRPTRGPTFGMGSSRHAVPTYLPTDDPPARMHWAWLREVRSRGEARLEYEYDREGRLIAVREGEPPRASGSPSTGRRTRLSVELTYNEQGLLSELKRPVAQGHGVLVHRRYDYDADGHLVSVTDSRGKSWRFAYAARSGLQAVDVGVDVGVGPGRLLVEESDRNGVTFYFRYDGHGPHARCIRTWGVNPKSGENNLFDEVLLYDASARQTLVTNAAGHTTVYRYDELMRVTEVMDPAGRVTRSTYDPRHGEKTSETVGGGVNDEVGRGPHRVGPENSGGGRTTTWTYDKQGNLTEVLAPDGAQATLRYDAYGALTEAQDPNGHTWAWHYDRAGRLISTTPPEGQSAHFAYDLEGRLIARTLPEQGRTDLRYDADGLGVEVVDAGGATTKLWFDALGQLVKVRDARGAVAEASYDSEGCVVKRDLPLGFSESYAYDNEDQLVEARTPTRHVRLSYSGFYQVAEKLDVAASLGRGAGKHAAAVRFHHDFEGKLLAVENELGFMHRFAYDPGGLLESETTFDGEQRVYLRDGAGKPIRRTGPGGEDTRITYDAAGRVAEVVHADGTRVAYAYRPDGALVRATRIDPDGTEHTVEIERDALGRPIRETSWGEGRDGGSADERHEPRRPTTDPHEPHVPGAHPHEPHVPGANRVSHRDAVTVTRAYGPGGFLAALSSSLGAAQTIGRDERASVTRIAFADHASGPAGTTSAGSSGQDIPDTAGLGEPGLPALTFDRDVMGQESKRGLFGGAELTQERDVFGRPTARSLTARGRRSPAATVDASKTHGSTRLETHLRYRGLDQLAEIEESMRGITEYAHDARGRLIAQRRRLRAAGPAGQPGFVEDARTPQEPFVAAPAGPRAPPSGAPPPSSSEGRDTISDATRQDTTAAEGSFPPGEPGFVEHRAMDAAGRIYPSGVVGEGRTYSPSGKLLAVTGRETHAFEHASGSIRSEAGQSAGEAFTQTHAGAHYTYDRRGRLVEKILPSLGEVDARRADGGLAPQKAIAWRYRWSDAGDLREVERPDGTVVRFAYDAFSRRVRKTHVRFDVPQDVHPLLAVPTETVLRDVHFTWSGAQLIHECEQGRITTYHYEPDSFVPIAKEVRHPTTDGAEGSDRHSTERFSIVTDHLGTPTEMLDDAGRIAWRAQLDLYGVPTIEEGDAEDCPLRFQGQYEDTETGLYQNRFRYYDPEAGQYISPDPIGLRGGLQPYGYVADPTTWVDPLGLAGCQGKQRPEDIARAATRNPESSTLVLGKFNQGGKSYVKVAAHRRATYFKVENWTETTTGMTDEEVWQINRAFLDQQVRPGKQIILSHDPSTPTGYFDKEVAYLEDKGYRFVQENWVWKAIR